MKKKLKSISILIILTALMFVSINSFAAVNSDIESDTTPKTSAATPLGLGTEKSFSFTNTTQFASYEVNFTANKIYQLNLTNDKGCNLRAYVHYPDYRKEYYYYNPDTTDVHGKDLANIYGNPYAVSAKDRGEYLDLSVDYEDDWNSTEKSAIYMIDKNATLKVNIYGSGKNQSLAWEDLGGKVKISDVTSAMGSIAPIEDGWVSSFNKTDETNKFMYKYKKVNVSESGLYNFLLNSTGNYPAIYLHRDDPYSPEILTGNPYPQALSDHDASAEEYVDTDQIYLSKGIYYLAADSLAHPSDPTKNYNYSSWDLQISKTALPTVLPTGSTTFSVEPIESNPTGQVTVKQAIMVKDITYGELFNVSVSCPQGYNISNPVLSYFMYSSDAFLRKENKTESGVVMYMKNRVPTLYKQNGKDVPNSVPCIYGYDQDETDYYHLERDYKSGFYDPRESLYWNMTENGIDTLLYVYVQNTSINFDSATFDLTFKSSSNQPETLNPGDKTFNFNHLSANDDEGIYKLNSSIAVGSVMEFKMKSMDNYARADMSFISNLHNPIYGDLGYIRENGPYGWGYYSPWSYRIDYKKSFSWTNETYSDHINGNYYDILPMEVAVLSDTWCILQDVQDRGYPDKNTTTFTLNLAKRSSYSLSEQFNKQRGTDLVLIEAELPSGSNIHLEELNGIIDKQYIECSANIYYDGVYQGFQDTITDIELSNFLYLISKDGTFYESRDLERLTDTSFTTGRTDSEYYLLLRLPTTHGVSNQTVEEGYDVGTKSYDEKFEAVVLMEPEAPQANIGTFKVTATFFETEEEGLGIPGYPLFITLSVSVFFIGIIAYISRKKRFGS